MQGYYASHELVRHGCGRFIPAKGGVCVPCLERDRAELAPLAKYEKPPLGPIPDRFVEKWETPAIDAFMRNKRCPDCHFFSPDYCVCKSEFGRNQQTIDAMHFHDPSPVHSEHETVLGFPQMSVAGMASADICASPNDRMKADSLTIQAVGDDAWRFCEVLKVHIGTRSFLVGQYGAAFEGPEFRLQLGGWQVTPSIPAICGLRNNAGRSVLFKASIHGRVAPLW
jgi:hypothetical protein